MLGERRDHLDDLYQSVSFWVEGFCPTHFFIPFVWNLRNLSVYTCCLSRVSDDSFSFSDARVDFCSIISLNLSSFLFYTNLWKALLIELHFFGKHSFKDAIWEPEHSYSMIQIHTSMITLFCIVIAVMVIRIHTCGKIREL